MRTDILTAIVTCWAVAVIGCTDTGQSPAAPAQPAEGPTTQQQTVPPEAPRPVDGAPQAPAIPAAAALAQAAPPAGLKTVTEALTVKNNQAPPKFDMVFTESKSDTPAPVGEQSDELQLTELLVAKGVENRQPVGAGTVFPAGNKDRLYAFLNVLNPSQQPHELTVSFAFLGDGKERGTVTVRVGAQKRWRTWAFTRVATKVGKWQVVVRDAQGKLIGTTPFEIVASPAKNAPSPAKK